MSLQMQTAVTLAFITCALIGCETPHRTIQPPYTVYRSPSLLANPPRRVLLLPIANLTYDEGFSKYWYTILAGELRSTKRFDVVMTDPLIPCVRDSMRLLDRGQYSEKALNKLRDYFRVDSVLYVKQVDYYPYTPPRLAVTANLVDAFSGETIAAIDGTWDAEDACVKELMDHYARSSSTPSQLNNHDLVAMAPGLFGKFVAHQLADSIDRLLVSPKPHFAVPTENVAVASNETTSLGVESESLPPASSEPDPTASFPNQSVPAPVIPAPSNSPSQPLPVYHPAEST